MYNGLYQRGSTLPLALQREALSSYTQRYTKDHRPAWTRQAWKDGKAYPVHFESDGDWLANTFFPVTKYPKRLRRGDSYSRPTWPDNAELRKHTQPLLDLLNWDED